MSHLGKLALASLTVIALSLGSATTARADEAVADFSLASNPNGNWSYGFKSTLNGSFTLYNTSAGGAWRHTSFGEYPFVRLDSTILTLHPNFDGPAEVSVVRWTAPTTGPFVINGMFSSTDFGDKTVAVLLNNAFLFTQTISGSQNAPFVFTLPLNAGDFLDFAVNNGPSNSRNFDSTGFNVTISAGGSSQPVPEPATMLLLGTGLAGVGAAARKQRKAKGREET